MDKPSSHPETPEEKKNHRCENSIFTDESVTSASVSENQTTVSWIIDSPRPKQINRKAAVTT
ncbi:Uncharacterized protein APZ42_025378 [Daphnia magna]|uniref:Uncharacterized protein n=1 Tax=Daphnia magna TaxID=35525 RepID=A0A164T5S9_9CRUS|nr:Uncharacterized protein APZ42_025378 [Daphnia magna]